MESNLSSIFANNGATEVFITEVSPEKKESFCDWIAKIHEIEATFPGFKGMYVQPPGSADGNNWMTFLQFDTQENLDNWLTSRERALMLNEASGWMHSFENHRVISPYAGWFVSATEDGAVPAVWKQSMLVLLVLYPLIMLELKYLSPITSNLDLSVATFIGNAISVMLIAWPMLPIAIWAMSWWLAPHRHDYPKLILGVIILLILYLLEIIIMWKFV
jgi:hypothetical protein